jgi:hypothetical protein
MTDREWLDLLENCERDVNGEPFLLGKSVDREGNPIENDPSDD